MNDTNQFTADTRKKMKTIIFAMNGCCSGCKWYVKRDEEYPSGCKHITMCPEFCLDENRPNITGIYYESAETDLSPSSGQKPE